MTLRHVTIIIIYKDNMADHKSVFIRAMFGALSQAESELRDNNLDEVVLDKALKELRSLVEPVANDFM